MNLKEILNWTHLLIMLSCRQSRPYWRMMGLPLHESGYSELSRVSRKALGALIAEHVDWFGHERLARWNEFHKELPRYQAEEALSSEAASTDRDQFGPYFARLVTSSEALSPEVNNWVTSDFRDAGEVAILIHRYIKLRLDEDTDASWAIRDACNDFSRRLRLSMKWTEDHFWIAGHALRMRMRSKWEVFLDELLLTDEDRANFSWFDPIQPSVEYQRFRDHWNCLLLTVGTECLLQLVDEFEADFRSEKFHEPLLQGGAFEQLRRLTIDNQG